MAKATFHSFRGEHSALITVKASALCFGSTFVYVPKEAFPEDAEKGDTIDIPDGYKIVDFIDWESSEPRTSKDGSILKVLSYE